MTADVQDRDRTPKPPDIQPAGYVAMFLELVVMLCLFTLLPSRSAIVGLVAAGLYAYYSATWCVLEALWEDGS